MAIAALEATITARPPPRDLLADLDTRALTQRSDRRGAMRLAAHAGCMAATGLLVWLATPLWCLLVPAMALHGVTIVTLFAPMHECVHRTAFASRGANVAVGWIAGVLSFYNSTFYWYFHSWHHRYTQDPGARPGADVSEGRQPARISSGNRRGEFLVAAGNRLSARWRWAGTAGLPFVPEGARRQIARSMSAQLLVYLAAAVLGRARLQAVLLYWFVPVVLAQPLLRAVLIAEHTGCAQDADGLSNTRTTLTASPVRAADVEHAVSRRTSPLPGDPVPPAAGGAPARCAGIWRISPGYPAANQEILRAL